MENEVQPINQLTQSPPIASIVTPTPKPNNRLKILLLVGLGFIIVGGLVLTVIQIGKNRTQNRKPLSLQTTVNSVNLPTTPTSNLNISPDTNLIPSSYQDCDRRNPKNGNFNPADYIFPFCNYFVEINNPLYQQCISSGGIKTDAVCMACIGCGCNPAGCRLTYIDPNFNLPKNYNECTKVFTHSGGMNIDENGGKENCAISFPKQGVFNKEVGEQLLDACFAQNGKAFGDDNNCELKFFKE